MINSKKLEKIKDIPGLELPNILDVFNFKEEFLGHAYMYPDGKVVALWDFPLTVHDSPSALRQTLIGKNKSTYTCFYFKNKSLKDYGV